MSRFFLVVEFQLGGSVIMTGISGIDLCLFGIGNAKWLSIFSTFRIGNRNDKSSSYLMGLGMGI